MKHPLWIIALALTAFLAGPAHAAVAKMNGQAVCTYDAVTIDQAGNLMVVCSSTTPPVPTPIPPPTQPPTQPPPAGTCVNTAGQAIPLPSNAVFQQKMCLGGSNNYVFDSRGYQNNCTQGIPGATGPAGTIQVFTIPANWSDGPPVLDAGAAFTSTTGVNLAGALYEVALSRCPGDFSYYKTAVASVAYFGKTYQPCGIIDGADLQISWSVGAASLNTCKTTPGEQWYMNWRVHNCPPDQGATCGQTFYVPRG